MNGQTTRDETLEILNNALKTHTPSLLIDDAFNNSIVANLAYDEYFEEMSRKFEGSLRDIEQQIKNCMIPVEVKKELTAKVLDLSNQLTGMTNHAAEAVFDTIVPFFMWRLPELMKCWAAQAKNGKK